MLFFGARAQWTLTGNSISATNFLGSTNDIPLTFKVNSNLAGYLGNVIYANTLFGVGTINLGTSNTGFGYQNFAGMSSTGHSNSSLGYQASYSNTTGSWNTGIGNQALYGTTTGIGNSGVGSGALYSTSTSSYNTALGLNALYYNTTGANNTAVGNAALQTNTTLSNLVAVGDSALFTLSSGGFDVAVGAKTLTAATSAAYNTAIGYRSAAKATTGGYNVAVGASTLSTAVTAHNNTALGYAADISNDTIQNSTAIGNGAVVNASNKIRFGNSAVTVVEGNAVYSVSDKRFKKDIKDEVKGLAFIRKLRPVVYNLEARKFDEFVMKKIDKGQRDAILNQNNYTEAEGIRRSGFLAQEVEVAAKAANYSFDGLHVPSNGEDNYSLSYTSFVVPLVKSVQELSNTNDSLRSVVDSLKDAQKLMQEQIKTILGELTKLKAGKSLADAQLLQNAPNPFNSSTVINYYLPDGARHAQLVITDASGRVLKDVVLSGQGQGQAVIHAGELASGTYFYSLVVNDQRVATRTMVLTR